MLLFFVLLINCLTSWTFRIDGLNDNFFYSPGTHKDCHTGITCYNDVQNILKNSGYVMITPVNEIPEFGHYVEIPVNMRVFAIDRNLNIIEKTFMLCTEFNRCIFDGLKNQKYYSLESSSFLVLSKNY
jgi:hypothetical protein